MKKGRMPRADELGLWKEVAKTAVPLTPKKIESQPLEKPPEPAKKTVSPFSDVPTKPNPKARPMRDDLAPSLTASLSKAPVAMDRKTFNRMSKGQLSPEGRLDLHGKTLDQAHGILNRFIAQHFARGSRLVLIITGKGKSRDDGGPIPVRFGVLRHQVPQWLSMPPLAPMVLQISQAHQKHGGGGAYYVYLRRRS